MLRLHTKFFAVVSALIFPIVAYAVTDQEMEQARVIAAKAYIRYVNDGSGYLDEINPKTLAELDKALKPKEKENIKPFLAIPVPSDYKNWDKQKLVEYWAVTAFQDKGLQEKGRGGRIRARSLINKMTVAAPSASQKPDATPAPQTTNPTSTETKKSTDQTPAVSPELPDSLTAAEEAVLDDLTSQENEIEIQKEDNYTWVYVMVLAILVALVIALVVYASNVMKRNAADRLKSARGYDEEDEPMREAREHLEAAVADKDLEIAMLTKKLESANRQNSELKTKIEALVSEVAALRAASTTIEKPVKAAAPQQEHQEPQPKRAVHLRSIFLGRANSRGIFVRADRTLNVGHSVYILDTTDGFSGSFRVADSPAAWSLALSNPAEYLFTACTGSNLDDTEGKSKIVTESSGTAIFEGGCWKVIRKAKIRYE